MKETFCSYTDFSEDETKKIREEMEELKNELGKTRNIVRVQRVRYQQLVSLFSTKLQEKEEETRNDLQIKHIQLTRILRALYVLEAKLRKEQRYLKSTLIERDGVIRTQQMEITKLKKEMENRCGNCVKLNLQNIHQSQVSAIDTDTKNSDNKPDLISSIGIIDSCKDTTNSRLLKEFDEPVAAVVSNSNKLENDENTYVIASLDDYDASSSSLRVRGTGAHETKETFPQTGSPDVDAVEHHQNANNENARNRIIDEKLRNEMRKFKMKENDQRDLYQTYTPRMILKEVTENSHEKLNDPVLKCVEQILSSENERRKSTKYCVKNVKFDDTADSCNSIDDAEIAVNKKQHPAKPPKPNFTQTTTNFNKKDSNNRNTTMTNGTKVSFHENTLFVKSLPNYEENQKSFVSSHLSSYSETHSLNEPVDSSKSAVKGEDECCERIAANESKIVQTVSTLLSDSAESEDEKCELSPTVSQMVKKFEGLKCAKKNINKQGLNALKNDATFQTNFEEFHLVDKEIDSTCEDIVKDSAIRLEAEGEENNIDSIIIETTNSSTAKYEAFLEVTGLSQKSILTPSRILSNHRNVVKPKDVKYRNRVKSAVIGEKCANGSITSPTMKYWTEPYL
ncbi:uncharacterized protein LOC135832010 isoform X2 [Planococcus citri]